MPDPLLDDLAAEHEALDAVVAHLDDASWDLTTPAPGWAVRHQIGHLAFFDQQATLAARSPDAFRATVADLFADPAAFERRSLAPSAEPAPALLAVWRNARAEMLEALTAIEPGVRVPWYGPDMSVRSFATARLMETWAHGQDVIDALGASWHASDRLRHVCHIGAGTYGWSFTVRGLDPPATPVYVELELPSGATWSSGEPGGPDTVRGRAVDFCLVVTQRRNVADTDLDVRGEAAARWMQIAQCFAGAATDPPVPTRR